MLGQADPALHWLSSTSFSSQFDLSKCIFPDDFVLPRDENTLSSQDRCDLPRLFTALKSAGCDLERDESCFIPSDARPRQIVSNMND